MARGMGSRRYKVARITGGGTPGAFFRINIWTPKMAARWWAHQHLKGCVRQKAELMVKSMNSGRRWRVVVDLKRDYDCIESFEEVIRERATR